MRDELIAAIVGKFVRQSIIFGNLILNYTLRAHPEMAASEEVQNLRALLRELLEEKYL